MWGGRKGLNYLYLYTLAVSPSLGGSRQHKKQQKQWGFHSVLLAITRDPADIGWHCWSNTARLPQLTSLHKCHLPYCPLPQGCLYKATPWQQQMPIRTASIIHHSFLFLACSLASLTSILLSFRALYSIHPLKPRPPSSTSPINFCIHYLFQQSFVIHPLHMTELNYIHRHVNINCIIKITH